MAVVGSACERVVDITVPTGPTRLVVQASLEQRRAAEQETPPQRVRQRIYLSTTAPYFANVALPPARGAVVRVVEEGGATILLRESASVPGEYVAEHLPLTVGKRYTLHIDWQGDRYEATDSVNAAVPIDSLYFTTRSSSSAGKDGLRATLDVVDPETDANYYLWEQNIDDVPLASSASTFNFRAVASDEFYNGRPVIGYQPYVDAPVRSGQRVRVRQYALSAQLYQFYAELNLEVSGDGSPFAVPATSVRGNVVNRTAASRRALGYFRVGEYAEREWRVP